MGDSPSQEALGNVWDCFWLSQWWEVGVGHSGYLEDQVHATEGTTSALAKLPHILVDFFNVPLDTQVNEKRIYKFYFPCKHKVIFHGLNLHRNL